MSWIKEGLIWESSRQKNLGTHSMIPTPLHIEDESRIRIYFSIRDQKGRALPYFIEVDARNPKILRQEATGPLLNLGQAGTFDANGVAVCSVVRLTKNLVYMYYVGFEIPSDIRYRMFTGLAISEDGGRTFKKYSKTPIMDRSDEELYFRCGPFVEIYEGKFRQWYVAGNSWTEVRGEITPEYSLKYAESADGISWPGTGELILQPDGDSYAYGRPWLFETDGKKQLMVSTRKRSTKSYEIENFEINENSCITQINTKLPLSETGSDSKMISYASVINSDEKQFCFYNGNDFGLDGIHFARVN